MTKKSFIKGAAVLGTAGLLVKLVGVIYRIPLQWIIGDDGLGIYQKAYPAYALLLMISTAGLPPAVSKLVATHMAQGDKAGANKVFRVALGFLSIAGLAASVVMLVFSKQFALLADDPLSQLSMQYIAPAIFFVAVMAAIRGYFQGMQNMFPTAMTQIVEQVAKVILGITFAYIMIPQGIQYGAAGAILGVMLSELIAMIVIVIYYFAKRKIDTESIEVPQESVGDILKKILKLAVPILIGASIMPIITYLDTNIITGRLISIGFSEESARPLFGIYAGRVNPLINVPGTVSLAFCVSIVAVVSQSQATGDWDNVRRNARMGLKMAMMVGLPSAVGLGVLSTPIMNLLYRSSSAESNMLAGQLLALLAGGVIFLSVLQTLNGVLQGMGRVMVPVAALGTGAIAKVVLIYTLIGTPSVGIYGAPISTFACYAIAAIIDVVMVKRITGVKFGFLECVVRPALASAVMGAIAWGTYHFTTAVLGNAFATLFAVLAGVIAFLMCIPIFRVMRRTEVLALPGGSKLVKGYDKLSWGKKDA